MEVSFFEAFVGGLASVLSPPGLAIAVVAVMFLASLTCARNSNRVDNTRGRSGILKYTLVFLIFYTTIFVMLGANAVWLVQLPWFRSVAQWVFNSKEVIILIAGLALFLISLVPFLTGKSIGFFGSNWFVVPFAALGGVFMALSSTPSVGPILTTILFQTQQSGGVGNLLILYGMGRAAAFLILPILAGWALKLLSGRQRPTALSGVLTAGFLAAFGLIPFILPA